MLLSPSANMQSEPLPCHSLSITETEILAILNSVRSQQTPPLKPLIADPDLKTTACRHARDMLKRNYFDHISPDGDNPHDRITRQHRYFIVHSTGENIWTRTFMGTFDTESQIATDAMIDWMNSPPHRAIILTPEFTHAGISVIRQGNKVMAVQHFVFSKGHITPPIPQIIRRGSTLNLQLDSNQFNLGTPKRFDLVDSQTLRAVSDTTYLRVGRLHCPSGKFRLRLHLLSVDESTWNVYLGPMVTVP